MDNYKAKKARDLRAFFVFIEFKKPNEKFIFSKYRIIPYFCFTKNRMYDNAYIVGNLKKEIIANRRTRKRARNSCAEKRIETQRKNVELNNHKSDRRGKIGKSNPNYIG